MSKKRILIVDDSKTALMMLQMVLKRRSYEIVTANNGREAVEKAKEHHPDLILMDVMMPELGGFDAVVAIRKESDYAMPIIMVTTRGEPENIERGYQCGCTDYVTKPIDALELISKIEALLNTPSEASHE
ncbi:MAG TPA: response regulator [Polyangiaceae bacterium]